MLKRFSLLAVLAVLPGCAGGGGRSGAMAPATAPPTSPAGSGTSPVACTLSVDVDGGASGGRIRITFTNRGAAAVPVAWQDVLQTYAVTVADAGGCEVPLTRYGVRSFRYAEKCLGPHATHALGRVGRKYSTFR